MKKLLFPLILGSLLAVGCNQKDKYTSSAEELCTCLKPQIDFYNNIINNSASMKENDMAAMMDDMAKILEDGQACVEGVEKKYNLTPEEEIKAEEAFKKVCPEFVALMNQNIGTSPLPESIMDEPALDSLNEEQ